MGFGGKLVGWVLCFSVLLINSSSHADIGLLLHESVGNPWFMKKKVDTGFWAQGGHVAVYVSDICAESPTKLRSCHSGEEAGVVISRYDGLSAEDYDWIAVPYSWYFYGVRSQTEIPLVSGDKIYEKLAERFYDSFLNKSIGRVKEGELPPGRWRDTLAASFRRDIYSFSLKTKKDTVATIVDPLNRGTNASEFDFFLKNCSDFAGDFFKNIFEDLSRTNWADTGLTSPKGVAQSVAQLGKSSPIYDYQVKRFEQIPGDYASSRDNLFPMENAIRNPKYALLLTHFQPVLQVGFGLVWGLIFRFNPEKEYQNHFSPHVSALSYTRAGQSKVFDIYTEEIAVAQSRGEPRELLEAYANKKDLLYDIEETKNEIKEEVQKAFGEESEWQDLQKQVDQLATKYAIPSHLLKKLDENGILQWQGDSLVVQWKNGNTILSGVIAGQDVGTGDVTLMRWIRLARLQKYVKSAAKNRPMISVAREELKKILEFNE